MYDPNLTSAATVTVMSPIALSRYHGSAAELLARLPIATGHALGSIFID
jgi:hypothetical protein